MTLLMDYYSIPDRVTNEKPDKNNVSSIILFSEIKTFPNILCIKILVKYTEQCVDIWLVGPA
jgi:hypothetical protein